VRTSLSKLRNADSAAFVVAGAAMGPVLGVTLSLTALQYIEAGVAASITAVSPLFAMLIAARFHNEPLTWRAWAGCLLAIAGVVVLFRR
jgi:drug/metabolite transporter (DMT)-like permease